MLTSKLPPRAASLPFAQNATGAALACARACTGPTATRRAVVAGTLGAVALGLLGAVPLPAHAASNLTWDDMIPADWEPMHAFADMLHLFELPDSDQRVQQLYEKMRKVWDEAPVVPALAGRSVRLPGYVVPLESTGEGLHEFLLVPYFGACIHTPPPPANQIVHVQCPRPVRGVRTMDAVWAEGVLALQRRDNTDMGISGYAMTARKVSRYTGAPSAQQGHG